MARIVRFWLSIVCVCAVLVTGACGRATQGGESQRAAASPSSARASHDLSVDETQGGHTLQRHVGRSDADLRERLARERHISAASTYTDRTAAEQAVAAALQENRDKIARWAGSSGGHPNLVLDYRASQPIGRTMNRGESVSRPCSQSVVVLRWTPNGYYALTSYPECR